MIIRFNTEGCKPVSTPLDLGNRLDSSQQPITDVDIGPMIGIPYRSAIGSLMYQSTCTRPDIAAAVFELSKFSKIPGVALLGPLMSAPNTVPIACPVLVSFRMCESKCFH